MGEKPPVGRRDRPAPGARILMRRFIVAVDYFQGHFFDNNNTNGDDKPGRHQPHS
jgi:hypothetical protein